jgi:hypothetical protein
MYKDVIADEQAKIMMRDEDVSKHCNKIWPNDCSADYPNPLRQWCNCECKKCTFAKATTRKRI